MTRNTCIVIIQLLASAIASGAAPSSVRLQILDQHGKPVQAKVTIQGKEPEKGDDGLYVIPLQKSHVRVDAPGELVDQVFTVPEDGILTLSLTEKSAQALPWQWGLPCSPASTGGCPDCGRSLCCDVPVYWHECCYRCDCCYDCCSTSALSIPRALEPALPKSANSTASLGITVPRDAVVLVNGKRTAKTGTYREYYSVGLKPGCTYRYLVHAEVLPGGSIVADNQVVVLRVGDEKSVAFDFSSSNPPRSIAAR